MVGMLGTKGLEGIGGHEINQFLPIPLVFPLSSLHSSLHHFPPRKMIAPLLYLRGIPIIALSQLYIQYSRGDRENAGK